MSARKVPIKLKAFALVLLVLQTTTLVLTMRYSQTQKKNKKSDEDDETDDSKSPGKYLVSTAVVMGEWVKLGINTFIILFSTHNLNIKSFVKDLKKCFITEKSESLKITVTAAIYTLQNNLLYLAAANLDAATYQVSYQTKILTTAFFSWSMMGKKLTIQKWFALMMLSVGVTCVQINKKGVNGISSDSGQNYVVGIAAILTSAVTSGFAGIYFERALKTGRHTMWMRNLESAFFSIIFGYIACIKDSQQISKHGFFQNYDRYTVSTIMLQAFGGMIIVAVVNYTDNIIKCFANACSIVTSAIASYLILQDFVPTWLFVIGACLVIISVFVYSSKEDRIGELLCFTGVSGVELDVKYANLMKEKVSDRYEERRASMKQGVKNVPLASGYKDAYSIA